MIDLNTGRVELDLVDQVVLDRFVAVLRSKRAANALVYLRRTLDKNELEQLGELLNAEKGASGNWGKSPAAR